MTALKQKIDIDQHAHTYQEIRNEEGIADKLEAVHQWRNMRNISV